MLTLLVNGEVKQIDEGERLTCLIHQQGIRIEVPESIEINGRNTVDCMEKMDQKKWEWISTGPLFKELFAIAFPEDNKQEIPKTIEGLNKIDFGVIHVCGLIVLACEAIFAGKTKIFFRNPEHHLHPKTERCIMNVIYKIRELAQPDVAVAEESK